MKIKEQETKTLNVRANDRSSDFISPNIIWGCAYKCDYCYARRNPRFRDYIYINTNTKEILNRVDAKVSNQSWPKKPNQVHDTLYGVDIGCSTDISITWKYADWPYVLEWFSNHPKCFATFATKGVNYNMLPYGNGNNRIRFSLMPQYISDILEPNTAKISDRIQAINDFKQAGWDVHINFSPVIAYKGFLSDYKTLFKEIDSRVLIKDKVFSEVIYLTHSDMLHEYNIEQNRIESENLLWVPDYQEQKVSQYTSFGNTYRYNRKIKKQMIDRFTELHNSIIPWNTIRYCF